MKKGLISIIIIVIVLATTPALQDNRPSSDRLAQPNQLPVNSQSLASAGGLGSNLDTVVFMSRTFSSQQVDILNTYANTNLHQGQIDLNSYQIPGWQLYRVTIDANSMTAAPEREVVGVTYENFNFAVTEILGTFYSQLAQGFYNQPFNGSLGNYSIYYSTTNYDSVNRGNAFFTINTNYLTSSAITTPTNMTAHDSAFSWTTLSGENAALNANQIYWSIINGTLLKKYGSPTPSYPDIYWGAENAAGSFDSYQKGTSSWDLKILEPLFRYTFTPWNRTADAPLQFFNPESLSLTANSTARTGLSWVFTSTVSNITNVVLNTNQSITLDYDLTLDYRQQESSTTHWDVSSSASPIIWNATIDLDYPAVSGITGQFVNFTKIPSDWTETGLYLGGSPAGSYSRYGSIIYCSGLSDGTWTLTSTGHNYVTDIALSDHSDSSPIGGNVSILVDIDIDASIEDGASNQITGGVTNLAVLQASTTIFTNETPAASGLSNFLWNISATTTGNGTHSIEVHWTNGTEAGYFTRQVFVYYPTSLVADDMIINAYTDNSFYVGVDFNQVFPSRGLGSGLAQVFYTFGAEVNVSMNDQTNGRWDKTISTTGFTSGVYTLYIYAEGYAIENQSLTITVNLSVETLALNWSWTDGNNITYLQSTNLNISYREIGGASISNAKVNVTFDGSTYDLHWDPISENYWIQLNGSDFITVPGSTILVVNAWKPGYAAQYSDSIQITINEVTGVVFNVVWNPTDRNITFIEQITITATYMYGLSPINDTWLGVWVRAYFSGHPGYVNFTYNSGLEVWQLTVDGSDYLGVTSVTVQANATGYSADPIIDTITVVQDIPSLLSSWLGAAYTTDYAINAPVTIAVQDSMGSDISDANLTVTINGTKITYAPGEYSIYISPPQIVGVYQVNVTMVRYGFTTVSIFLNLTVRATTDMQISVFSSEYEQWNLTVTATYSDTLYSTPITGATVIITLDGTDYILQYAAGVYTIEVLLDVAPGSYTLSFSATAPLANPQSTSRELTVIAKSAVHLELLSEGDPNIEGQVVVLTATLLYNDTGNPVGNRDVYFVITIHFVNGSTLILGNSADTTNAQGVATFSFQVPAGTIESIQAEAYYPQSQDLWGARRIITVTAGPNPLFVILYFFFIDSIGRLVTISMIVLGVVATAYNRRVKPKKRLAMASLDNQLQMFIDLESLRHFMAVYLDRGTCVFYHPFTDERIQPDLISGFIAAITSVYGEIKGDGVRGTLEEIQYHGLRLNSYSGEKIIGILILEGDITPLIKDRLQFFVELFENQYEKDLEGWTGLVDCFDTEWIVSTLNSAFNYSWLLPHRIGQPQKVSKTDAKILDYITAVRDERGEFYIRKLLSPLAEMLGLTEAQVLDRLLTLHDRNVIVPVNVQTVLQRQGMGLSEGQEIGDVTAIGLPPEPKEEGEVEEKPAPKAKKKTEKVVEEPTPAPEPEEQVVEPAPKARMKPQKFVEEPTPAPAPEEQAEKPLPEPEKKEDEMEAFVRHVESLLAAEAKKKKETEKEEKE